MPLVDRSGTVHNWDAVTWCGSDRSPLSFSDLALGDVPNPHTVDGSVWNWASWFPVPSIKPLTLGEGGTPLVPASWLGGDVHLKLDNLHPTGSFKDRGAALVVAALRQAGAMHLLEDSSGNGGASMAAYAAAAGLTARVLVPVGTSPAKIAVTKSYGAEVVEVPGDRQATSSEALRQVEDGEWVYASHAWHPLFPVGVATQALEIWWQLGRRAPRTVVVVAGGGSMVLGHDLAWRALRSAGLIDSLPHLVMVQPMACAPLVDAWQTAAVDVDPAFVAQSPTVAEGTAIAHPVRDREVLAALRRLDGVAVATSEESILAAQHELASHGHDVEPTAANAVAGWHQTDIANGTTVIVMSGSGHKLHWSLRARTRHDW